MALRKDICCLPEHGHEAFPYVLALDLLVVLADLVQSLKVFAHVVSLRILYDFALSYYFVVVVQIVDVGHEVVGELSRNWNRKVEDERAAEVAARLHQIGRTEVVVLERAHVVSAKGRLYRVDRRAFQFVEECHPCS